MLACAGILKESGKGQRTAWLPGGSEMRVAALRGQASLELLFAVLVLVVCTGIFIGALEKAGQGAGMRAGYWAETEMLSEQALLAQEYASAGRHAQVQLQWDEWKANGNVIASVKNNASVRAAVRAYSDVNARRIEKSGLEGA